MVETSPLFVGSERAEVAGFIERVGLAEETFERCGFS